MLEYLEILETVEENPEFICSDVTDFTDILKADVQVKMEDIMSGKHYSLVTHYCYHDVRGKCETVLIKEV